MDYSWYSRMLVRKYWLIIGVVFFISLTCVILPLVTDTLPSFKDPQVGFEARGTELARRLRAWENLKDAKEQLTNNPLEYYYYLQGLEHETATHKPKTTHHKGHSKKKHNRNRHRHNDITDDVARAKRSKKFPKKSRTSPKGFFCNDPMLGYARVVIGSKYDDQDLWTLRGIRAQCHIDNVFRTSAHFSSLCQVDEAQGDGRFCRSWSPANYVAFLTNRTSCEEINEADLSAVRKLLMECHFLYLRGDLTHDCAEDLMCKLRVPVACYRHGNAVYHMIHYLLDVGFFPKRENDTDNPLHSAMLILPVAASTAAFDYYENLNLDDLVHGDFQVVGMEFDLKNPMFDRLLISDSYYLCFGFIFVSFCIWTYTGSLVITLATLLVVLFSLAISFTIYRLVLQIELFPFMNLLAVVVAVGIGSDDAFIFCKVWESSKRDAPIRADETLFRLTHETIKHALPAMFVSTLTTAVAFFASVVSNVTAINCFSIFSGITVIVNFLLMITCLPACVIADEQTNFNMPILVPFYDSVILPLRLMIDRFSRRFIETVARVAISLRWVCLAVFGALSVAACFVVFYRPGLQLPDSPSFQLFHSNHPFERFEMQYSQRFYSDRPHLDDADQMLTMRFVWGVLPVDNGNHFNLASKGSLVFDPSFNVSVRESQQWLHHFCERLRHQPFYHSTLGPLLPNCFIESMRPWMERSCQDPVDLEVDHTPCCRSSAFPYKPWVLSECVLIAIAEMYRTPSHLWHYAPASMITAGPRFPRQNQTSEKVSPEMVALVVEYDSNFTFSYSFAEMDRFYRTVEEWTQAQLESAPPGLKNGWFVSDLQFYELQRTLYDGTIWSIVVSMGLAFAVLGLVTLNPFVSLFAILTVAAAIVVTVAVLVLLGWRLNVLENVAVSTAIGLTVDFSMHYGVCYRHSNQESRELRVKEALDKMAGPTLMAALTTGVAGALVLPSQVLAYIQIGVFLVIVMAVSWVYATFLLCPMLAVAGPTARFAQFERVAQCANLAQFAQFARVARLAQIRMFRRRRQPDRNAEEPTDQEEVQVQEEIAMNALPSTS